jgi:hypothetical protein
MRHLRPKNEFRLRRAGAQEACQAPVVQALTRTHMWRGASQPEVSTEQASLFACGGSPQPWCRTCAAAALPERPYARVP